MPKSIRPAPASRTRWASTATCSGVPENANRSRTSSGISAPAASSWPAVTRSRTRCWELRDSLTFYDAAYVALAEAMHATLLTADRRLARATGPQCLIEILPPSF